MTHVGARPSLESWRSLPTSQLPYPLPQATHSWLPACRPLPLLLFYLKALSLSFSWQMPDSQGPAQADVHSTATAEFRADSPRERGPSQKGAGVLVLWLPKRPVQ